ncbi:MAG: FkbM family methyltransferase [Phycisphaerales bacterium]|nr:FkbM family methyltransferase [Phycisphaerales bacterium]
MAQSTADSQRLSASFHPWTLPVSSPTASTTAPTTLPQRYPHAHPARFINLPTGLRWFVDTDVMSRTLEQGRLPETDEYPLLAKLLKPGMTVLDVGAHRGLFAMHAHQCVAPGGRVIAFEPSPRERHYLRVHQRINRCPSIHIVPCAVANQPGEMILHVCLSGETGCNSLRPPMVHDATLPVPVAVTTLDDEITRLGLSRVDFVKMDIEGAERDALRGAMKLLVQKPRPMMLMEVSDLRTGPWGYRAVEIYDWLTARDYHWFNMMPGCKLSACSRKHAFHENLLAVPVESLHLIYPMMQQPLAIDASITQSLPSTLNTPSTDDTMNSSLPPVVVPANPAGGPPPAPVNLFGDRHIEWSWIAAHITTLPLSPSPSTTKPASSPTALEFGPGDSWLGLIAVHKGYKVTAIDLQPVNWPYVEPALQFQRGDLLEYSAERLPGAPYDLVINCSVIEHVGLAGRYGVQADQNDGDLQAMAQLKKLMKPGATMLLTIPVGRDAVFAPMCRVYGENRLPRLLAGFTVMHQGYWIKNPTNHWVRCDRATALAYPADARDPDWRRNIYGLGCFVLGNK